MLHALLAGCLALVGFLAPAGTAAFIPDPVDTEPAKREGTVTWYTSTPVATAQKIANLFQTKRDLLLPFRPRNFDKVQFPGIRFGGMTAE